MNGNGIIKTWEANKFQYTNHTPDYVQTTVRSKTKSKLAMNIQMHMLSLGTSHGQLRRRLFLSFWSHSTCEKDTVECLTRDLIPRTIIGLFGPRRRLRISKKS